MAYHDDEHPHPGGMGGETMNQNQQKVMRLLLTARGQMDAVIRMMEEGRYCVDISNQLLAIDALIRKANADVLSNHLRTCVKDSIEHHEDSEKKLQEVEALLHKIAR